MALPDFGNEVPNVSAATATKYVREMVELETVTSTTREAALRKLARDYGLTVSQLTHLYKAKAKTCDVSLFARVKAAYLDRCAKMAARLLHTIEIEEASGGNAHDQDLVDRLIAIHSEVLAKSSPLNTRREMR
jgi:predicted xylose isomerase-like sugar epimerase